MRLIRASHAGPGQRTQGNAFNGCFAQGLASCWLPGVRNAHEFPSTSLWESLTGSGRGRALWLPAPLPCLSPGEHWQVKRKLPLNHGVQLVSFRTNHPSNESTLSLFFRSLLPNFNLQVCAVSCCRRIGAHFCFQYTSFYCTVFLQREWLLAYAVCKRQVAEQPDAFWQAALSVSLPAAARQRAPCWGPPALLSCRGTSGTMETTRREQRRTSTRG